MTITSNNGTAIRTEGLTRDFARVRAVAAVEIALIGLYTLIIGIMGITSVGHFSVAHAHPPGTARRDGAPGPAPTSARCLPG